MIQPKTSYARNGDVSIAYQVIGDGPLDLLFTPAFVSHLDLYWAAPETAAFFRRLASFSRLILFDKRGTGLSDPVAGVATLEERMQDLRAVLDAVGSQRAALFGLSEGGPMSLLFAATYPERTTALVLFGSFAKLISAPGYFLELGEDWDERVARFTDAFENHCGEGKALALYAPSLAGDANAQRMLGMFERAAASPAMVRAMYQFNTEVDVTRVLPVIGVPTLVLHRTDDLVPIEYGRYLAEHVRGACAIREDLGSLGVDVRAGVHTGECEVIGPDIGGMAVHIAARVVARAAPGEVLVSGAVRDLVVGSGIEFVDRGTHELKGVPGEWQLLAVAGARTDGEPTVAANQAGDPLAPNAT